VTVEECIRNQKRGKAAGLDELTVEHLLFAHPINVVLLSLLFNMLFLHGLVPQDLVRALSSHWSRI